MASYGYSETSVGTSGERIGPEFFRSDGHAVQRESTQYLYRRTHLSGPNPQTQRFTNRYDAPIISSN